MPRICHAEAASGGERGCWHDTYPRMGYRAARALERVYGMSANYTGQRRGQRDRRFALEEARAILGDRLFAEFMIDQCSEQGSTLSVVDLPALARVWLERRRRLLAG